LGLIAIAMLYILIARNVLRERVKPALAANHIA
jgi:hypothetical protein